MFNACDTGRLMLKTNFGKVTSLNGDAVGGGGSFACCIPCSSHLREGGMAKYDKSFFEENNNKEIIFRYKPYYYLVLADYCLICLEKCPLAKCPPRTAWSS